ncbi:translation initiation factor IF-2 N-terminal domain-containing protein [Corynebacterium pseudodiphtheriticum]|uniref:translation initiation factor IF-2 N-terminal domain-containing protein n=1 Tax=Corynebacterium pseudodiphtheriticum TaxID=37637 RepID=UPI001F624595|nr:translation initiation factor IF-2 N-terminal domain-containing protein [Corynebacterium pseudodiphtheriticum]UNU75714.1 Rne/Rng family ribonuclease [Corynebacterium pseudodiphtheriticum]UNU77014.1 Rne/Rng family ribonuclease [Corynebacterium pseudodiphtheriticum]
MNFTKETIEKASTLTSAAWPEKTRVYTLAKNLGLSSRELIGVLADLQISKRAQSNVAPDEVTAVLDYIASKGKADSGTAGKADSGRADSGNADQSEAEGKTADKSENTHGKKAQQPKQPKQTDSTLDHEAEEKLRHRVRKNVENEINQIVQKVAADLPNISVADEPEPAPNVPAPAEPRMNAYVPVFRAPDVGPDVAESEIDDIIAATEEAEDATGAPEENGDNRGRNRAGKTSRGVRRNGARTAASDATAHSSNSVASDDLVGDDFAGNDDLTNDGLTGDGLTGDGLTGDDSVRNDNSANNRGGSSTNSRGRRRRGRRGGSRGRGSAQSVQTADADQGDDNGHVAGSNVASQKDGGFDESAQESSNEGSQGSVEEAVASTKNSGDAKNTGDAKNKDKAADNKHTVEKIDEPRGLRGSDRLEAQRRRRNELREESRKTERIVSESEFQERRAAITRKMVVCERPRMDGPGTVTQLGLLEDDVLVEHFVNAENQGSMIGNIYLGRVENVLRNMEAAFIDIGQGRNAVLYAGEVDWKARGLSGHQRRIEAALKPGDQVLVQVMKDPLGHKGARLTAHISFSGRYLVYVPGGRNAGISRKLPAEERKRLKDMLERVVPEDGGTIIRTAAEGVPERAIAADVDRMHNQWLHIKQRMEDEMQSASTEPVTLFEEPDMLVKVVRDLFNEDYTELIVDGDRAYEVIYSYVKSVAPDLLKRITKHDPKAFNDQDSFTAYHIDEQIQVALSRNVPLPSGGSLVIDRTEAMIVIDVNTGKFTGKRKGGNLEETVTRNNLEAVDEIVRQIRLRDLGGMIVIDFIDMILEENQDLVLRRLKERLTSDRSRHQVSEVTSLGLVQLTRKRIGTGLLEAYAADCPTCSGRGVLINSDPVDAMKQAEIAAQAHDHEPDNGYGRDRVLLAGSDASADGASASDDADTVDDEDVTASTSVDVHEDENPKSKRERERAAAAEFENLAASVIGKQQPKARTSDRSDEPTTGSAKSGRAKRGKNRRNKRAHDVVSQASVAAQDGAKTRNVAEKQIDTEAKNSAEAKNGAEKQNVGDTQPVGDKNAYEKAVAEFESSPRRRRRTRGNSRSDHRPRKADFRWDDTQGSNQTAPTKRILTNRKEHEDTVAQATETAGAKGAVGAAEEAVRKSMKRRRVVRRISAVASQSGDDSQATATQQQAGDASDSTHRTGGEKHQHSAKDAAVRKSTRRRRVVRRPVKK